MDYLVSVCDTNTGGPTGDGYSDVLLLVIIVITNVIAMPKRHERHRERAVIWNYKNEMHRR